MRQCSIVLVILFGVCCMPGAQPLVQLTDLTYQGAFRLPEGVFGGSRFGYGGTALVYHAPNHTLMMVGNAQDQMVAEVSIPDPLISNDLNALNTAAVLQPFTEVSEGLMATAGPDQKIIGGLWTEGDALTGSVYVYYDAGMEQTHSHFRAAANFATTGEVQGLFTFGEPGAGFYSGYMAAIPTEWQSRLGGSLITGNCCIPIISRTSLGPAAFAFQPSDLANPAATVNSTALVYYPIEAPLAPWDSTNHWFNGSTIIKGVAFPEGSSSVLFFGRQGVGAFCYGTGEACNDPADPYAGTHAYPYIYQIWAYDAHDLMAVAQGEQLPWNILPYALWELQLPFADDFKEIGGVAYDRETRRLYLSQLRVDGTDQLPLIHVFELPDYPASTTVDKDNPLFELSLFPQPASHQVNLSAYVSKDLRGILQITGINGAILLERPLILNAGQWLYEIDLQHFKSGFYVLSIQTEQGVYSRRLFVKN